MAVLPLYKRKDGIPRGNNVFPDDYDVLAESIVDDDVADHPLILAPRWTAVEHQLVPNRINGMRARKVDGRYRTELLHRFVWELFNGPIPSGKTVDHIDRDVLNNRIVNLRLASRAQQNQNKTKRRDGQHPYKGICTKTSPKYRNSPHEARVILSGSKPVSLGLYPSPHEAAYAYNLGAIAAYGEYAVMNDIPVDLISISREQEIREGVVRRLTKRGVNILPLGL